MVLKEPISPRRDMRIAAAEPQGEASNFDVRDGLCHHNDEITCAPQITDVMLEISYWSDVRIPKGAHHVGAFSLEVPSTIIGSSLLPFGRKRKARSE